MPFIEGMIAVSIEVQRAERRSWEGRILEGERGRGIDYQRFFF